MSLENVAVLERDSPLPTRLRLVTLVPPKGAGEGCSVYIFVPDLGIEKSNSTNPNPLNLTLSGLE